MLYVCRLVKLKQNWIRRVPVGPDSNSAACKPQPKRGHVRMQKGSREDDDEVDWPKMVCSLQSRIEDLEKKPQLKPPFGQRPQSRPQSRQHQGSGYSARPSSDQQGIWSKLPPKDKRNYKKKSSYSVPTCFRCSQQGHLKIGCRALLPSDDESTGNDKEFASAGRW